MSRLRPLSLALALLAGPPAFAESPKDPSASAPSASAGDSRWAELTAEIGSTDDATPATPAPKTPARTRERVNHCFEEARAQGLGLPERVSIEVDVHASRVLRVRVSEEEVAHVVVRECLVGAIRGATLEESIDERTFSWSFIPAR